MEFDKVIKKRASVRKYSDKDFPTEKVIELIDYANLAPSPGNLPLLKYIIVQDPFLKTQVASACQQNFVQFAKYLIVVCSDSKESDKLYDKRSKKYTTQHAGAAIENLMLKATDLGLSTCWIGAFSERMLKDILRIPDNIEIEAVITVSYQLKTDSTSQKKKHSLEGRIFFEYWKYKEKLPNPRVRREDI